MGELGGLPSMDNLTYRRDLGKQAVHHQTSIYDAEIETGYRNSEVQLIPSELLGPGKSTNRPNRVCASEDYPSA